MTKKSTEIIESTKEKQTWGITLSRDLLGGLSKSQANISADVHKPTATGAHKIEFRLSVQPPQAKLVASELNLIIQGAQAFMEEARQTASKMKKT